jgi:hypothetical protein
MTYRFITEVPRSEVEASGISVSSYSYYDPTTDMVYLEEDCDATAFIRATGITDNDISEQWDDGDNPWSPRNMDYYEGY